MRSNSNDNNDKGTGVKDDAVAYALLDDGFRHGDSSSSSLHCPTTALSLSSSSSSSAASAASFLYLPYTTTTAVTTATTEDDIVSQWYNHYAHMYPSVQYVKQQQQQRLLLQQQQQQQNEQEKSRHEKSSKRGGLLGLSSFIGKWITSSSTTTNTVPNVDEGNANDDNDNNDDENDNDNPKSTTPKRSNKILEEIIIPPREATSFHRFHLVSQRRALSIPALSSSSAVDDTNKHDSNNNNNNHKSWNNIVIPVRPCMNTKGTITTQPIPYYCIVGYGQIAEFNPSTLSPYNNDQTRGNNNISSASCAYDSKIFFTSDWQHLSNSFPLPSSGSASCNSIMPRHDPRHIRAASIGRDCLVVSWGMMVQEESNTEDGIVFYRKLSHQSHPQQQTHEKHHQRQQRQQDDSTVPMTATTATPIIGWEAVAVASPSDKVVRDALRSSTPQTLYRTSDENDTETKGDDEDPRSGRRLRDCRSLIITDLIPITIGNDIVLVISRLGGYVELFSVPSWVWGETTLYSSSSYSTAAAAVSTTQRGWRQKDKKTSKDVTSHLPNLTALSKITSFSTAQYHSDVVSMDAYSCVESTDASKNSYRVEVILAACGRRQCHRNCGDEVSSHTAVSTVVSLWGLSIDRHHSNLTQQQPSSSTTTPALPTFRVNRLGHATLENVGADVSSFLSDTAAERWATNHRSDAKDTDINFYSPPSKRRKKDILKEQIFSSTTTTVVATATAPIVSLRFTPPCQNNVDATCNKKIDRVLLAALDYNGGVSVFDCTESCAYSIDDDDDVPLDGDIILFGASSVTSNRLDDRVHTNKIRLVSSRDITMSIPSGGSSVKSLSRGMKLVCASQIEWWPHHEVHGESSFTLATYATMIRGKKTFSKIRRKSIVRLQRWSSSVESECSTRLALEIPEDILYVAMSSNTGVESSISLLPKISQHLALIDHETQSFFQLSAAIVPAPSPPTGSSRIFLRLSVCGIKKFLDPTEIISALLRQGDASKALDVARRFGFGTANGNYRGDERLMNECQIDLWNTKRDPQAFKLITDDEYVIRQALELSNDNIRQNSLSLNDLFEIFREALARCEDGEDDQDHSACQLRNTIRRLGTFNLVLNHVTAATTGLLRDDQTPSRRFLRLFNQEALHDIAACAASKGDSNTLTVIIARHPFSLHERMGLLDLIPCELHIRLYEHLMPCYNKSMKWEEAMFLFRTESNGTFLSRLQFFAHLSDMQLDRQRQKTNNSVEEFPIDIFTDDSDRYHVMQYLERASSDASDVAATPMVKEQVVNWYLKRALHIQNKTGQALLVRSVCAAGLVRSGLGTFSDKGGFEISDMNNISSSVASGRLVYLYFASSLVCLLSLEKMKYTMSNSQLSIEVVSEWKDRTLLTVPQLCSMEISDVFHFIVENGGTHGAPLIQKHLAHLMDGSHCLEPMNNGTVKCSIENTDLVEKFEHDMAQLCVEKLRGLRGIKGANLTAGQDSHHLTIRLEESLAMCANFISFGQFRSERNRNRSDDNTIMFADSIFCATLEVINGDLDLISDSVIGKLWSIFELVSYTSSNESERTINDLVSVLHFKLATLHLCNKWHDHQTFPHDLFRGHHGIRELCVMGLCVISFVCSGFCDIVARMTSPSDDGRDTKQQFGLLFDFVSDVDEFDNRFFSAAIQHSGCLVKYVFSPLLYQQSFAMLHDLLKVRESWFNRDLMCSTVSTFIRDVSTSQSMMMFWDVLGQWFPDLHVEVEYRQRMIDAREFVVNAMNLDGELLTRLFSVDRSATELVHTLLSIGPQVLLLGCEFWSDEVEACSACTDAVVYFTSVIHASLNGVSTEESNHVLPPMPGALIMQLANILGLDTPDELLIVKRYMVEGALKMSLVSAAVAICYSMLCDAAFSRRGNTASDAIWSSWHESQVLDCVVALAKDQSFIDSSVKKEMFTFALRLCATANSHLYLDIFDELRSAEYEVLATTANHRDHSPGNRGARVDEASDFSVLHAAELVAREFMDSPHNSSNTSVSECENNFFDRSLNSLFHDIKISYQIDLLQLFAYTWKRSVDNNESTMKTIGEAIFRWIISEAYRARIGSVSTILSVANVEMMLDLGLSCLLECHEHDTSRVLSRTINNFKSKSALSMNRRTISPSPSFQPDQSIVQRLMDRGYTRNAARRAVMTTSNQSYSAALTWAVSHFQDDNFDSPIFFLRSEDPFVDQYLIDVVDKLLRNVQRIAKEKLSPAQGKKTQASVKVVSSHSTSSTPKERFVFKVPSPSSRESPILFPDKSTTLTDPPTLKDNTTGGTTALASTTVSAGKIHHSTISLKKPFVSKLPSPSTIQESYPLTTVDVVKDQTTMESPPAAAAAAAMMIDRSFLSKPLPPMPNSADSSSVEGSLSSRASIKNQIQRGMTKFGTQKLSAEERNKLALEGRRLLEEARARGRIVMAPPAEITTTSNASKRI